MPAFETLYIAEKPSLAEAIAKALAERNSVRASKAGSAWEVGDARVTWFFGHMYELAEPKEYDEGWAKWSLRSLPIVVRGKWKMALHDDKRQHMRNVAQLLRDARTIVNCGDAAREGQLLVDEALFENGVDPFSPRVRRLWVQSLASRDLQAALAAMRPNAEKQHLYESAVSRQRADWQHGMTYSRLFTLLARNSGADVKISVGRVQTPTLRLVVDRDRERTQFRAVDHYLPQIRFQHANGSFVASWRIPQDGQGIDPEGRLLDRGIAQALVQKIAGKPGKVRSFKSDNKSKAPPLPYSLSALQADCSAKLGLTAQETLNTAQALYETHKVTSYPRSDCRYLPLNILKDEAPGILRALSETDLLGDVASAADPALKSEAWNDAKISDHYAIIPTTEFSPGKLKNMSDTERKVFALIARAFIAQFYPPFRYKSLAAEILCEGEQFHATGRQILDHGWKRVYGAGEAEDGEEDDEEAKQTLPVMAVNDPVRAESSEVIAKRTTPPPAFTDGTLVTAMANAHRFEANPEYKKRLKEGDGIGTEATRAETIETLVRRGYLKREGKNKLRSTPLGQSVIDMLPDELKSLGLTAIWEMALRQIEEGRMSVDTFMSAQAKSLTENVAAWRNRMVAVKGVRTAEPLEGHGDACPKCGVGRLITVEIHRGEHKGKRFLACSNRESCDYRCWPKPKVEPLDGDGKACPKCGHAMRTFLVSKDGPNKGRRFLGCTNKECRHSEWPVENPLPGHGKPCPACSKGTMVTRTVRKDGPTKGKRFLSCSNMDCRHAEWPDGGKPTNGYTSLAKHRRKAA